MATTHRFEVGEVVWFAGLQCEVLDQKRDEVTLVVAGDVDPDSARAAFARGDVLTVDVPMTVFCDICERLEILDDEAAAERAGWTVAEDEPTAFDRHGLCRECGR